MSIMRCVPGILFVGLALACGRPLHAQERDLDTRMMLATYKVANAESTGTGFILSRPSPGEPGRSQYLLVTARHVLERMKGEEATIVFRKKAADGAFAKVPLRLRIRKDGKDLWTKHPTADVGVIEITPPPEAAPPTVPVDLLATDATLARYEVHPGDLVKSVGYPHANQFEPSPSGFAVARLGCIASYPLLPTKQTRTFLFDFNVFEGDSGSPVYLSENGRIFGDKGEPARAQAILGLVSGQHFLDEEFKMVYQTGKFRHRMGMGIVVHATLIRETIDLMPQKAKGTR
jgi:hypothetical protein